MKKYLLLFAFLLGGISMQAQSKVGTIDVNYILGQLPEINSVEEGLKKYNAELQEELQKTIKKYEDLVTDYQATNATLSEEEKKTKENEIVSLENDIRNFRQKASVLLEMRRNELTQPLYEKIDGAMQQVIQDLKYTQVINVNANALAYGDPAFDITDDVLTQLGITPTN